MHVLVTGGTGVVGRSTVTALLQRGHVVRLLSRHAERDAAQWPHGVNAFAADIRDPAAITGAADSCDVVLHLAASVHEKDARDLNRLNIDGTRHLLEESTRADVKRFVYVSSLGADSGKSDYHQSKRAAEALVRDLAATWTIVRPGNVYGPGDEQISLLLRMIRSLPVIPSIGGGDQEFQPIWHGDLAEALAIVVEREDLAGRVLDIAGPQKTSQKDLVQRLSRITNRHVATVDVPEVLTSTALKVASAVGIEAPFTENQLRMLKDGNVIEPGAENALTTVLNLTGTPLDEGLRQLADAQDEQLPHDGVGPLRRKRYWADMPGLEMTPEALMAIVRADFPRLMASFIDAQAETTSAKIEEGATLTLSLPLRGHVQVRVAENEPRVFTLVSLAGHPLAGAVRFLTEHRGTALRFEVQVFDRAANLGDLVVMRTVGEPLQDASWRAMVQNVARLCGFADQTIEIQQDTESLDKDQATRIDGWLTDLVMERRRDAASI